MRTSVLTILLLLLLLLIAGAVIFWPQQLQGEAGQSGPAQGALIVVPDTQKTVRFFPEVFTKQLEWIASQNKDEVKLVIFLGDLVDKDTTNEWETFVSGIRLLEKAGIAYALAPGNHDYPPGADTLTGEKRSGGSRSLGIKKYNQYMQENKRQMPTLAGMFEDNLDNNYHIFSIGERQFLVLMLEFGPRDTVLAWANDIIAQHPDYDVIVATHTFLNPADGKRHSYRQHGHERNHDPYSYGLANESGCTSQYDREATQEGCVNDGEQVGAKLIDQNRRIFLTLNGHLDGVADVPAQNNFGETICQYALNFQDEPLGGYGYLALLTLKPAAPPETQIATSQLYSPVLNQFRLQAGNSQTKSLCATSTVGAAPAPPEPADSPFSLLTRLRYAATNFFITIAGRFQAGTP